MSEPDPSLEQAYATCRALANRHYENFPVASRFLPPAMRPHVAAVYAFARGADDLADEGELEAGERLARLEVWRAKLHAAVARGRGGESSDQTDQVFAAVAHTIHTCDLPIALLEDLLSAFRQDVTVCRYERWADLLDYCRRSANPIGRLVLRIAGYRHTALEASSDSLCSALQITNFLQDFQTDWHRGRLYVPADVMQAHGAKESDLEATRLSPGWRAALSEMADRTRRLFDSGRAVCDGVGGRLKFELRATWLGGRRILDRLESTGYDPLDNRPTLGMSDYAPILWKVATWRRLP